MLTCYVSLQESELRKGINKALDCIGLFSFQSRKQSTMLFDKSTFIVILTAAIASVTAAPSAAPVVTGLGEPVHILLDVCH